MIEDSRNNPENPLVSVIIPVYLAEGYLEKCIISVVHQTYRNLDILLVDDGSLDGSPKICDKWAEKDARIRVIHKKNSGVADTRNIGLRYSKGEFVAFVDADDWIALTMIEKMLNAILLYHADMAICQYADVFQDGQIRKRVPGKELLEVMNRHQVYELLLEDVKITNHLWRKLYRRKNIPDDVFPFGKEFEDIYTMPILLKPCEKIVCLGETLYFYRFNERGIVNRTAENRIDLCMAVEHACRQIALIDPLLKSQADGAIIKKKMEIWTDFIRLDVKDRKLERFMKNQIRRDMKGISRCLIPGWSNKGFFLAIKYFPFLDQIFYNWVAREESCAKRIVNLVRTRYSCLKEAKKYLAEKAPQFLVLCSSEKDDLCEIALLEGERQFVDKYFPDYSFFPVPLEHAEYLIAIKKFVRPTDPVIIHRAESGSILYWGKMKKDVIGNGIVKKTNFIDMSTGSNMILMNHFQMGTRRRKGALICLRDDPGRAMTDPERDAVFGYIQERFTNVKQADSHVYYEIQDQREAGELLASLWSDIEGSEIVVTDRPQIMLLAAVVNTPCLALAGRAAQIGKDYEWIKEKSDIRLVYNTDEIPGEINYILSHKEAGLRKERIASEFDRIAERIREMEQRW